MSSSIRREMKIKLSFSKLQKRLSKIGLDDMSSIIKTTLKNNPYLISTRNNNNNKNINPYKNDYKTAARMWDEACLINFPVLLFGSILLHEYTEEKDCNTVLFATRDGCHWHKLYKALYDKVTDAKVVYFNCSRNMFESATQHKIPAFDEYVKSCINQNHNPDRQIKPMDKIETITGHDGLRDNIDIDYKKAARHTVYVDIHGSGRNMYNYFHNRLGGISASPFCFLLTCVPPTVQGLVQDNDTTSGPNMLKMIQKNRIHVIQPSTRGGPIEMLNYDIIGTLQTYDDKKGPIRDLVEYNPKIVEPYHAAMNELLSAIIENKDKIATAIYRLSKSEKRMKKMNKYCKSYLSQLRSRWPAVTKYIDHERFHPKPPPPPKHRRRMNK